MDEVLCYGNIAVKTYYEEVGGYPTMLPATIIGFNSFGKNLLRMELGGLLGSPGLV
jgi:hypothetical protein